MSDTESEPSLISQSEPGFWTLKDFLSKGIESLPQTVIFYTQYLFNLIV